MAHLRSIKPPGLTRLLCHWSLRPVNLPGSCFAFNKSVVTPLEFDLIWLTHQWGNLLFRAESLLVTSQKFLIPLWEEETEQTPLAARISLKTRKVRDSGQCPNHHSLHYWLNYTKEASWVQRPPSSSQRPYLNASVDGWIWVYADIWRLQEQQPWALCQSKATTPPPTQLWRSILRRGGERSACWACFFLRDGDVTVFACIYFKQKDRAFC